MSLNQQQSIVGELLFLRTYPSGWGLGKVLTENGAVSVNGNALTGLKEKSTYEFTGKIASHPKYGDGFQVVSASVYVPYDKAAIIKYLQKNYSGIGEKTATRWVDHQLKSGLSLMALRENILANPFAVDFSAVTKRKTTSKQKGGIKDAIYRNFAMRLGGPDTSDAMFRSLSAYYLKRLEDADDPVGQSWAIFNKNPYAPIRDLDGYGFLRADLLGKKMGFPNDAPERIAALATHALDEGCISDGHTYLELEDFKKRIAKIDPGVNVKQAYLAAQDLGEPITYESGRFYLAKYLYAEQKLAANFATRLKDQVSPLLPGTISAVDAEIQKASKKIGLTLDDSQLEAVRGILQSRKSIHTITAGPGCGKTAIMEVVVSILSGKKNIGFCAPTGKAAKVLSARVSSIGAEASTIHGMLGVEAGVSGFIHNEKNPLPFELLVVDETSMVDLQLMHSVVSATLANAHIVFLGDTKQLPSVGPGSCLADILKLPFDHYRLTKTHRNQGGIYSVIQQAGNGIFEPWAQTASGDKGTVQPVDAFLASLVDEPAPVSKKNSDVILYDDLPEANASSMDMLVRHYHEELSAVNGDFSQVGLLIARRKGDPRAAGWNTTYLNNLLRDTYNGNGQKVPGTTYNVNDRIIIRKNLTLAQTDDKNEDAPVESVVNGDTGYIRKFVLKDDDDGNDDISVGTVKYVILELDDGRRIKFGAENLGSLDLAYAMTVHSAQGSEYKRVISICVNGAPGFIHRGILFTAWSRAKEQLRIIGIPDVISAILRRPTPVRNSHLVARVKP